MNTKEDPQVPNTTEVGTRNTPPGITLELVDDYDEEDAQTPEAVPQTQNEDSNSLSNAEPLHYQDKFLLGLRRLCWQNFWHNRG